MILNHTKTFEIAYNNIAADVTVDEVTYEDDGYNHGYEVEYTINRIYVGDEETGEPITLAVDDEYSDEVGSQGYSEIDEVVSQYAIEQYRLRR